LVIGLVGIGDLDGEGPLFRLRVGLADTREDATEHVAPVGDPVGGGVVGAVDRDAAMPGLDVVEQRLLLRAGEHVLEIAAIGVDHHHVILVQNGGFEDRGILVDRHLVATGVFQQVGQVQCLVTVAVVVSRAAGQEQDLGASGDFAFFWANAWGAVSPARVAVRARDQHSERGVPTRESPRGELTGSVRVSSRGVESHRR
jgi:hypothetical protein